MNAFKLGGLLLILLAIVLQFSFAPRYRVSGGELQENGNFKDGLNGWKVLAGRNGSVTADKVIAIRNRAFSSTTMITQSISVPRQDNDLLVKAELRTRGVVGGLRLYQRARIYLVGRDRQGKYMWQERHSVVLLEGNNDWQRIMAAIPVPKEAVDMLIGIGLSGAKGEMEIRYVSVSGATELTSFRIVSLSLLALLLLMLAWIAIPVIRAMAGGAVRFWLAGGALATLTGIIIPGPLKRQLLDILGVGGDILVAPMLQVSNWAAESGWDFLGQYNPSLGKISHFLFFAFVAALSRFAWPTITWRSLAFYLVVSAGFSEVLQFYAIDRHPSLMDGFIDTGGILSGLVIALMSRVTSHLIKINRT